MLICLILLVLFLQPRAPPGPSRSVKDGESVTRSGSQSSIYCSGTQRSLRSSRLNKHTAVLQYCRAACGTVLFPAFYTNTLTVSHMETHGVSHPTITGRNQFHTCKGQLIIVIQTLQETTSAFSYTGQ